MCAPCFKLVSLPVDGVPQKRRCLSSLFTEFSRLMLREQFLQGPLGQTPARDNNNNTYIAPISTLLFLSAQDLVLDLVLDQDQKYKITLKIEGKAGRTAKGYKFICPIFPLDKTSLRQGLEKLSDPDPKIPGNFCL